MDDPFLSLDAGFGRPETSGWMGPTRGTDVGDLADFPVGSFHFNAGVRAVIARDAMGLYAFSAVCSHAECLLRPPDAMGVSECPCHGAQFDRAGHAVRGPATQPLARYAVHLVGTRVFVDVSVVVSESARAALPMTDAGPPDAMDAATDAPRDVATDTGPRDTGVDVDPCTLGRDVGPIAMFALNTWTLITGARVVVARDAMGLFAYSAICTHNGCTIGAPDTRGASECACHGSQFDGTGNATHGPAVDDLSHFAVHVCGGRVRVDSGTVVATAARTPAA